MKTYDNSGKVVAETNRIRTSDGAAITSHTMFNTHTNQVASQTVSIFQRNGKVTTTSTLGGKLLP